MQSARRPGAIERHPLRVTFPRTLGVTDVSPTGRLHQHRSSRRGAERADAASGSDSRRRKTGDFSELDQWQWYHQCDVTSLSEL